MVPEVKMYRVGVFREEVERSCAGTGSLEVSSSLSNKVCTCACSLVLFMTHTWMLSSWRLVRMPFRESTRSEG